MPRINKIDGNCRAIEGVSMNDTRLCLKRGLTLSGKAIIFEKNDLPPKGQPPFQTKPRLGMKYFPIAVFASWYHHSEIKQDVMKKQQAMKQSRIPMRSHKQTSPKQSTSAPALSVAQRSAAKELAWVGMMTRLLDTQFRIPGTRVRFGFDFIMGLIPGAGDLVSMGFSGVLIAIMAKNGASGMLVSRMLINVLLDTVVGSVPILGNFFDLFYKANYRNLKLMNEHYQEGKHSGSVWPLVLGVIAVFLCLFVLTTIFIVLLLRGLWNLMFSA
jgi:hypothetical protein